VSLARFASLVGVPVWRLRDHVRLSGQRQRRLEHDQLVTNAVRRVAFKHPTWGYRKIHRLIRFEGLVVGDAKVREVLLAFGLKSSHARRLKRFEMQPHKQEVEIETKKVR
jgi:hypothetical protein